MCRWFAYIAPTEHCLLEDVLILPPHALSKQVHDHYLPKLLTHHPNGDTTEAEISLRNRLFNVDGFGVAWYTSARGYFNQVDGKRPALYKNSQPPSNDANFHSICANTGTTACFAHIRAASSTAVVEINNHPFIFGRHSIMHNGLISNFLDIKRDLLDAVEKDAYENIKGTTDSEHLAALYITFLTSKSKVQGRQSWEQQYSAAEMAAALTAAINVVIDLQLKALGALAQANSLNVAVTDGVQMVAIRYRNHEMEQPPSLYWSDTAGITLNRKYRDRPDGSKNPHAYKAEGEHGKHIIVASEPTTYKKESWNLIPKNAAIWVQHDGTAQVKHIDVPSEKMARGTTTEPA